MLMELILQCINEDSASLLQGCSWDLPSQTQGRKGWSCVPASTAAGRAHRDVSLGGKHQHLRKSSWEFTGKRFPFGVIAEIGNCSSPVRQQRPGIGNTLEVELGSPDLGAFSLNWADFQVGTLRAAKPCKVRFPGRAAALEKGLCQWLPRMMEKALEFTVSAEDNNHKCV